MGGGMPAFVIVGNQHSVCRHSPAELGPTVGLRESAKMNPTKCMRIVTCN